MKKAFFLILIFLTLAPKALAVDGSLICDGASGSYASRAASFLNSLSAVSIEFWYKTTSTSQSEKGFFSRANAPTSDSPDWFFQRNGTTNRYFNGGYDSGATQSYTSGTWHHVYLAADDTNNKTYYGIDGTVTEVSYAVTIPQAYSTAYLCSSYSGYLTGEIDELRISNNIRYTGNYTPPTSPYTSEANTLGLYHFDQNSGTTITDSANSNDFTMQGTLSWGSGYYVAPTATPTSAATSTPTPTPTPSPAPTGTGKCFVSLLSAQEVSGSVVYLYHIKNNSTSRMTSFELPDNWDTGTSSCGNGWANRQNIDSSYRGCSAQNSSQYLDRGVSVSYALGVDAIDEAGRVTCVFEDSTEDNAILRPGGSLSVDEVNEGQLDTPIVCDELDLGAFTFPNWFCEAKQYISYLVTFDQDQWEEQYTATEELASEHVPFSYLLLLSSLEMPEFGSPSAIPAFSYTYTPWLKGSGDLTSVDLSVSADKFAGMQTFVNWFRGALEVLVYVGGFFGFVAIVFSVL